MIKKGMHYVWHSCAGCGEYRWVRMVRGNPISIRCISCSAKIRAARVGIRSNWKGGRFKHRGYVLVLVRKGDPFCEMVNYKTKYIGEHRLVMAKHLGRCLEPWEVVHHKNHIRDDNRIENLQLMEVLAHRQLTLLESKVKDLEKRILLLEVENELLGNFTKVEEI